MTTNVVGAAPLQLAAEDPEAQQAARKPGGG